MQNVENFAAPSTLDTFCCRREEKKMVKKHTKGRHRRSRKKTNEQKKRETPATWYSTRMRMSKKNKTKSLLVKS